MRKLKTKKRGKEKVEAKYQIDQSGKIEQTNKNTVLAIANSKTFSILLKAKDKRLLQDIFRTLFNKQRQYVYEVFSALVYLLLSTVRPKVRILIDKEYPGQEDLIKLLVLKYYDDQGQTAPEDIEFGLVGKSSPAHNAAYKVFKKKIKPTKVVTFEEVVEIIFPSKKTGYSAINRTEDS